MFSIGKRGTKKLMLYKAVDFIICCVDVSWGKKCEIIYIQYDPLPTTAFKKSIYIVLKSFDNHVQISSVNVRLLLDRVSLDMNSESLML